MPQGEEKPASKIPLPSTSSASTSSNVVEQFESPQLNIEEKPTERTLNLETLLRDKDPRISEEVLPYVASLIEKSNRPKDAKEYCSSVLSQLIEHFSFKQDTVETINEEDAIDAIDEQNEEMAGIDIHKLVRKPKMFNGKAEHPKLWLEEYTFCCDLNS